MEGQMEKKLTNLFEYQRFEGNKRLQKLIDEAENRAAQALDDDDLAFVAGGVGSDEMSQPRERELRDKELHNKELRDERKGRPIPENEEIF